MYDPDDVVLLQHYQEEHPEDAVHAKGIPGWDRVDALARALLDLTGLYVTNAEAQNIQQLYDQLLEYDKRPLTFKPVPLKRSRGRFRRSKKSGHVGVKQMERYDMCYPSFTIKSNPLPFLIYSCFLSAGLPASNPSKSRVVEALCIHLCQKHGQSKRIVRRKRVFNTSRWKQVLASYNSVRARLHNSEKLLDGTNLVLYSINESTHSNEVVQE